MKKIYSLLIVVLMATAAICQTPINTSHTTTTYLASAGGVSFNVQNTSSVNTIRVKEVRCAHAGIVSGAATVLVWYKTSAIAAAPGAITAANGWICAGAAKVTIAGATPVIFLSTLHIDIPPSSTYGIFASTSSCPGYDNTLPAGTNTFTAGSVNLLTGTGISFAGVMTGPTFTPRGLVGGISYITLTDCSTPIVAGTIDAIKGFCGTAAKTYTLKNNTQGNGIAYQWQTGTTSTGPWTNLAGATAPMLNRTISATTYYRCYLTCTGSGVSDTTPVFDDTLKPFYYCYCASSPALPEASKIDSVKVMNTVTGSNLLLCQMYTDNRETVPNVKLRVGTTLKATMMAGICDVNSNLIVKEFGAMYFDINQNGVFDAGERMGGANFSLITHQPVTRTMAIPLSTPLGTTGLRIMLFDSAVTPVAAGITNPCGPTPATGNSYGEVEDYLVDIIQDPYDAHMNSLLNVNEKCGATTDTVKFNITNIGGNDINPLTVNYSVNGGTTVSETFGTLAKGATQTYAFSTLADYTSLSNISLKVWHSNTLDTNKSNDTLVAMFTNYPIPPSPSVQNATSCAGASKGILRAISNPPFLTRWYKDAAGLNDTAVGNQFVVDSPSANITYYAKSVIVANGNVGLPVYPGPAVGFSALNSPGIEADIIGNTSGIVFDVLRNRVTINSVKVKFTGNGLAVVDVRNAAGTVLKSFPVSVQNAPEIKVINLNYTLPVGTGYRLVLSTNPGCVGTWANNPFPMSIPNVINLTGSITSGTVAGSFALNYVGITYNTFYDWNVSYDACASALVPVSLTYVSTTNNPIRVLRPRDTACQFPGYSLNAKNNGCTYLWQDNSTNQTIQTTVTKMYSVVITNSLGCTVEDTCRMVVLNSPLFTLGADKIVCFGSPTELKTGFTNRGYNHRWNTGSLDPNIYVNASGKYWVDVTNTVVNCSYVDSIEVTVVPLPNVYLGRDTFACNNTPITIYAPTKTGYSFVWDDGTSASSRTLTSSKKIWVSIQDNSGPIACSNSDTVDVTISKLKKPNLGADRTTCNLSEIIGIVDTPGRIYRWNTGESTSLTTKTSSGTYALTVAEDGTTCTYSDTIKIVLNPNLPLDLGPNIQTCQNNVVIKANKGFTSYVWSPALSTTDTILAVSSNTYRVTATSPCGTITDNVAVTFLSAIPPFQLPNDTVICSPLVLSIPTSLATGNSVNWSTGDSVVTTITVNQTGNYWVSVRNICGAISDAINIIKDTTPTADFVYTNVNGFVTFQDNSLNAYKYSWKFGDPKTGAQDTSSRQNPSYYYDTAKKVTATLTVENSCGVKSTKTVDINLLINGGSGVLNSSLSQMDVYPNPSSDHIFIKNMGNAMNKAEVRVYSIDGKVVFSQIGIRLENNREIKIDVTSLSTGTYLLIINNDKESFFKKISISK